jgi:hypothetical protein
MWNPGCSNLLPLQCKIRTHPTGMQFESFLIKHKATIGPVFTLLISVSTEVIKTPLWMFIAPYLELSKPGNKPNCHHYLNGWIHGTYLFSSCFSVIETNQLLVSSSCVRIPKQLPDRQKPVKKRVPAARSHVCKSLGEDNASLVTESRSLWPGEGKGEGTASNNRGVQGPERAVGTHMLLVLIMCTSAHMKLAKLHISVCVSTVCQYNSVSPSKVLFTLISMHV